MRILIITRNFPPDRGGIQRLVHGLTLELAQKFDVALLGPRGCAQVLPPEIAAHEVPAKPLWWYFVRTLQRSLAIAHQFRPDMVLAGSGLTAPFAWFAARFAGGRMGIYVHGLDLIARHPIYRWLWRPFIRRADICITNSRNTASLAAAIGVPASRIAIVHPGVDMPGPAPATNDFRERFGIGDGPMLLSVGRLIARKGLLEFVENSLPEIVARYPDIHLVVLGDEEPDLLHGDSSGLGARIRQRADALGISRNVKFIGPQNDATLAAAYRAADVHVFPVREVDDDVEGFGMVAVEAAAHGLPTVAFSVGGVPDAVGEGRSGVLVTAGDYPQFAAQVVQLLGRHRTCSDACRAYAADFAWSKFGERLRGVLSAMNGSSNAD